MQEQTACQHVKMFHGHFPIPCFDLCPNMDLNFRTVFQKCKTVNTYIDGNLTGSSSTEIATIMLRWQIEEQRRQELIQKSKPRPSQPSPHQKLYDMLCEMDLKEKEREQETEQLQQQLGLGPVSNFSFEWDSDEEKDQLQYMEQLEEAKWLDDIRKQDKMLTQQWAMEDFQKKQSNCTKVPKPKKRRPNQRERLRWRKNKDQLNLELAEISRKWSRNPKRAEKSHGSGSAAKVRRYIDLPYSGRLEVDENGVLALHTS